VEFRWNWRTKKESRNGQDQGHQRHVEPTLRKAFVTRRLKPMMIDGKKVYQIGLPIHQGFRGIDEDEGRNARTPANLLTPQSPTRMPTPLNPRAS